MQKKIVFSVNGFSRRGTEVAIYDYAYFNETILGNTSYIIYSLENNAKHETHDDEVFKKFKTQFDDRMSGYSSHDDAQSIIDYIKPDCIYFLRAGKQDHELYNGYRNAIHVVFDYYKPYGDDYFYISEYLARKRGKFRSSYVPHIIHMPEVNTDLREKLGIPKDATVVGRYGGATTFDLKFVHEAITEAVQEDENLYILFANTNKFFDHPRVIHLDPIYTLEEKATFINTCDAYLHARSEGETFGLAIAEFHILGKNVLTSKSKKDNAHLDILGDECYLYHDKSSCKKLLFNAKSLPKKNYDAYKQFSPEKVMQIFNEVVIEENQYLPTAQNLYQKFLKMIFQ
ncbi:hypothetical protein MY04_2800 [Flammeovirga sp. MY04]|uniref:glycosyltransferase n=1 Tax=Flammeovirga sp. MY04 TaxID=1191459 RepID=UPI00080624A5|nr:glycosyltransferase [Flammeovirga sp. MY04]ANQ50168.1 hypothetical protein MY04_2800 [Flammeovirga sp. MY04]